MNGWMDLHNGDITQFFHQLDCIFVDRCVSLDPELRLRHEGKAGYDCATMFLFISSKVVNILKSTKKEKLGWISGLICVTKLLSAVHYGFSGLN